MKQISSRTIRALKVAFAVSIFLAMSTPTWAILGVRRRTARRTAVVVHSADQQQAAAQQQQAAQQQAAADQQAAAQQQAAAAAAAPQKTTTQKLQELQSLLDQGLITQTDYDTQKTKILSEMD